MNAPLLNLTALQAAPLVQSPYPYVMMENFIPEDYQQAIETSFPLIQKEGSFPLSAFRLEGAMLSLIQALDSDSLRAAIASKFAIDLEGKPTTITLRGYCTFNRDGKIHTDSKDKLITVLLYLGADAAASEGRLRLLYNQHDLNNFAAEISPDFGHCVMFQVTPHGWHGFTPVQGQRRAIQLNYVVSAKAAAKNIWRHQLAAFFKRFLPTPKRA